MALQLKTDILLQVLNIQKSYTINLYIHWGGLTRVVWLGVCQDI